MPMSCLQRHRIVTELGALHAEVDALKCLQAETAAQLDALPPAVWIAHSKAEL